MRTFSMHSSMDLIWIRPVRNPPHCKDVNELSSSAVKVLRALQRTYQPHCAGIATVNHYLTLSRALLCQQVDQQFEWAQSNGQVLNVLSRPFNFFHGSSVDAVQPVEGLDNLEPSSRHLSDLSPHIDNLHLSTNQINAEIHPSVFPFSNDDCALASVSKHQNFSDKECEEISDIFAENCVTVKEKGNVSSEIPSEVSLSPDIYQDVDSDSSSPMSMFNLSEVFERNTQGNTASKDRIRSHLKFTDTENSGCRDFDYTQCDKIEKNEKWMEVCPEKRAEEVDSNSVSMNKSIGSRLTSRPEELEKMRELPNQTVNWEIDDEEEQEKALQASDKSYETRHKHVVTDHKNSSNTLCLINERLSSSSPVQRLSKSFTFFTDCSSEIHSQRHENDVSEKSDLLGNFHSEGISTDSTEGRQSNVNSAHKKNAWSPNVLKSNTLFGLKTPIVQRKFLGTPFKRALFSSTKSSKACLQECSVNSIEESTHKESVSDENVQNSITSGDIFVNESNKQNHVHANKSNGISPPVIQKAMSEKEQDMDSGSKLLHPIFRSSKRKADICATSDKIFVKESNKENHACANITIFQSTDSNASPIQKTVPENSNNKESGSKLYFPIFKSSSQSKGKAEDSVKQVTKDPEVAYKKRLKFAVPYKQKGDRKSPPCEIIQQLTETLAKEIEDRMLSTPPHETALTLLYKEGFCQLNRPKTCKAYHPEKIFLRIMWPGHKIQYMYATLQSSTWCSLFLSKLLSDKSRKICFDAQEIIQLLVDTYGFNACEVSSTWLILDPLIGCWLLNPDEPPHSFKDVLNFLKVTEKEGNCKGIDGTKILINSLSQSAEVLYESLTRIGLWKLFLHIEMRITPILACMELHGIQVNVKKLKEMAEILKTRLDRAQNAAYEAAGRSFQLTSPQQLSAILYEHLKLDTKHNIQVKETDKRHDKSTSESMLIKFKDIHPLPGIVLEFRRLHKHKSTYVDAVLGHISGGCIYTTWDQISAATGRITSNEPNLQATPKQPLLEDLNLRSIYTARHGNSFLAADFQQIELRVFAHLSKDNALIQALGHTTDVFKMLAQKWLDLEDTTKVSDEDREKTKRIVYAVMYGAGPSKLSEFLHMDYNQACSIFNKFSDTFPKMQQFSNSVLDQCRKQGYLSTEAGRRRWFPHISSPNTKLRLYSERQAVNFLIQGTAADICKCAMVHTQKHIAATGTYKAVTEVRLLLQIHDELLWEVPDADLLDVADVVQEAMEGATAVMQSLSSFSVSLPVVMKVGKTWGDMKTIKNASLVTASQQV